MSKISWDDVGKRFYETGVDRGVFYKQTAEGKYPLGEGWDGLTSVSENPSGADANDQYANNSKYLTIRSKETFAATIEAFQTPEGFKECNGLRTVAKGVTIGQQTRTPFGFTYRTIVGNDTQSNDYGYIIHVIYGATCSPSGRQYTTVGDSTEPITLSYECSTTPVAVTGYKPTASMEINSALCDADKLKALEDLLYGTDSTDPQLPTPDEIIALVGAEATEDSEG